MVRNAAVHSAGLDAKRIRQKLVDLNWYTPAQLDSFSDTHIMLHTFKLSFLTPTRVGQHVGLQAMVTTPAALLRELLLLQHETDLSGVRKHPFVITLRWSRHVAMVCVDMEQN